LLWYAECFSLCENNFHFTNPTRFSSWLKSLRYLLRWWSQPWVALLKNLPMFFLKFFVEQLVSSITDRMDANPAGVNMHLTAMSGRMDTFESQMNYSNVLSIISRPSVLYQSALTSSSTLPLSIAWQTSAGSDSTIQVMMAVELEKSERLKP